jgi:hypothetical protein
MVDMLFLITRVNEDVIDEHNDKLVQILHEHFVHHTHKIGGSIG